MKIRRTVFDDEENNIGEVMVEPDARAVRIEGRIYILSEPLKGFLPFSSRFGLPEPAQMSPLYEALVCGTDDPASKFAVVIVPPDVRFIQLEEKIYFREKDGAFFHPFKLYVASRFRYL